MAQDRYLAIRHDGKAIILEGHSGEHYQYAERDFHGLRPLLKERYDAIPDEATYTRHVLRSWRVHGPSGHFRMLVPDHWTFEECGAWARNQERAFIIGPALGDPHQIDRSRQMERHYHGS